jgi:phosphate starvation-inducible PhoH-like protein
MAKALGYVLMRPEAATGLTLRYNRRQMVFSRPRERVDEASNHSGLDRPILSPFFPGLEVLSTHSMKASVRISRGVESLFGTRDENIRLFESGLSVHTQLVDNNLEIEGEAGNVSRAESILEDYAALVREGHVFNNGDLNSYLRVVTLDPEVSLRALVESGRQRNFGKKALAPKSVNQRRYLEAIERNDMVFGIGPAGTGKTYLAVAMAISALMSKRVARIILTRPAVEAGERLGFLPGTLQEKVDPYLRPLYDALYDMLDSDRVEKLLERNVIEVAPIAFMRGRTLNDSFIILDEAQNSTAEQMKMVLTRQGFNSKMVVNGDVTQIDLPTGRRSGLLEAVDVVKGIEGISFVQFDERDVVRHSLVQRIVKAYERYNETVGAGRQLTLKLAEPDAAAPETAPGA